MLEMRSKPPVCSPLSLVCWVFLLLFHLLIYVCILCHTLRIMKGAWDYPNGRTLTSSTTLSQQWCYRSSMAQGRRTVGLWNRSPSPNDTWKAWQWHEMLNGFKSACYDGNHSRWVINLFVGCFGWILCSFFFLNKLCSLHTYFKSEVGHYWYYFWKITFL